MIDSQKTQEREFLQRKMDFIVFFTCYSLSQALCLSYGCEQVGQGALCFVQSCLNETVSYFIEAEGVLYG